MKSCTRCKEVKSHNEFTKNKSASDGLSYWCKSCKKLSDKRYIHLPGGGKTKEAESFTQELFNNNPPKRPAGQGKRGRQPSKTLSPEELKEYFRAGSKRRRHKRRVSAYGITVEQHKQMLELQEYKCLICSKQIDMSSPIDHCHNRSFVRGILCRGCNIGLGHFLDNPQILRNAAEYLEFHIE
jgi:hypothetical protein